MEINVYKKFTFFEKDTTHNPTETINSALENGANDSHFNLDTMATVSLTNTPSDLTNLKFNPITFINAGGSVTTTELEGTNYISGRTIVLESAPTKLASFGEVIQNYLPVWDDQLTRFNLYNRKTGKLQLVAPFKDRAFPILEANHKMSLCAVYEVQEVSKSLLLHYRLNHQNAQDIKDAVQVGHYTDVFTSALNQTEIQECVICSLAKDSRLKHTERGTNPKRTKMETKHNSTEEELERVPKEVVNN
jgi:hypothetical protein